MMVWRLLFGCCLGLLLLSCSEQTSISPVATPFGDLSAITAGSGQIAIFSGMPNPQWLLDADAVAHIQQVIQTATTLNPSTLAEPPGLGFAGMSLELRGAGEPLNVTVFNEAITIRQASTITYLSDPDRVFERWLLANARPQLEPAIYDLAKHNLP
ncbi:hypothetical protein [Herpetosiphon giganteus]|uniref:hypothetical protein n=1 Tax=Herpetosiphon giganteus TaxID=2029754 RepID=UPI00195C3F7C|nr:hypothetical protein [Herpetosiphon giganteus]MBM7844421.1 hypothetical protein [Herpetosiphon giganteus]